ncbi:reverse transcriptase domain-containing protein [Tanacetum coccineum]
MFQDFRYSDTAHLSRSVEVLKLKNFKKDATLKLFKNGMSMSVQKSQVHKMAKFQDGKEIVLVFYTLNDESRVEAMKEELLQFKIQKVWTLVDLPSGKKAIEQGYKQEEGIDYDEVFAHVARVEAIRLFLAFASFMNFPVYQMDVNGAFLYGTIEEEDKYVGEILKKFGFSSLRTASTPMETNKALTKDEDGKDVDVYLYRTLLFILEAFSDSDVLKKQTVVANSLQSKLNTLLLLTAVDKYFGSKIRFALIITSPYHNRPKPRTLFKLYPSHPSLMATLEFSDKHNMVAFLQKPTGSEEFHQIVDFLAGSHIRYALTANPTIYTSLIEQFWQTATVETVNNGEQQLTVIVDGQTIAITEASVRRHLQLADADGISSLPNTKIFEQLTLMGYVSNDDKLTFQKGVHIPLFDSMLVHDQPGQGEGPSSPGGTQHTSTLIETSPQLQNISNTYRKTRTRTRRMGIRIPQSDVPTSVTDEAIIKEMHDGLVRATTTASSVEAEQGSGNIAKTQTKATSSGPSSPRTSSEDKVTLLEDELASTKAVYNKALITLTKRVKKLEKQLKHKRRRAVIDSSEGEGPSLDVEDSPKQGRMIEEIDNDETVNLVKSEELGKSHDTAEHNMESKHDDDDDRTLAETLLNIKRSAAKGKAIMQESEPPKKIKKKEMIQISLDEEFAKTKQTDEREKVLNWNDHDVLRYHAVQNRPYSKAEVRKNMCTYLKNQGGYKMSYFKGMSYEDIRPIFERAWDQNQAFVPKDSEIEKEVIKRPGFDLQQECSKKTGGSRKKTLARKRAGEKQSKEGAKRQKTEYKKEKEELKAYLDLVPREEFAMEIESLDGGSMNYKIFSEMLDDFDRHDVMDLHRLVEVRYATSRPEGYDLMLWGDLKILFQPDEEDEVWRHQHEYNLISWRLFDSCGIHILLMDNGIAIHMMIEKKYPLTQEMLSKMLSRKLEVDHENEMVFELLRFIRS